MPGRQQRQAVLIDAGRRASSSQVRLQYVGEDERCSIPGLRRLKRVPVSECDSVGNTEAGLIGRRREADPLGRDGAPAHPPATAAVGGQLVDLPPKINEIQVVGLFNDDFEKGAAIGCELAGAFDQQAQGIFVLTAGLSESGSGVDGGRVGCDDDRFKRSGREREVGAQFPTTECDVSQVEH